MKTRIGGVALIVLLMTVTIAFGQGATATTTDNLRVRAGAGRDQPVISVIPAQTAVILEARSDTGDWALVHLPDNSARGWVAAAYLAGASIGDLPLSDERMAAQQYTEIERLRGTPVVPGMTATAYTIYQRGRELGNAANRFSKVGDCQNVTGFFLAGFDRGDYVLGEYAGLQATIDYFAGSFHRESASVSNGFNIYSVTDPSWAGAGCLSGESPIECEYRLWQPSFVIISLEMTYGLTAGGYESEMREVVQFWIDHGVVPILATKADNREGDWSINAAIARVAWSYDVPLWNFLMAAQPLPDFGLTDGFHLTFAPNDFSSADNLTKAWAQRNLTALQTLDVMRRAVS